MTEGTFAFAYFPDTPIGDRWPFPVEAVLANVRREEVNLQIITLPSATFRVLVDHDTLGHLGSFESQPVRFGVYGSIFFTVTWSAGEVKLYVNGDCLHAAGVTSEEYVIEGHGVDSEPGPLSFDHPDVLSACVGWVTWRARYANVPPPKALRRQKEGLEQVRELAEVVQGLGHALENAKQRQPGFVGVVAGMVRSLVYWQDRPGSQYNPLLLRLAGRINLALPIYAFPNRDLPTGVPQPEVQLHAGIPSIVAISPDQLLVDVQEWLVGAAITQMGPPPFEKSVKDVLSEFANTGGGAHFDEDAPEILDEFRQMYGPNLDQLAELVLEAGRITFALGHYALEKLESVGYGR